MHVERMRVSALILVGVVPLSIVVACGAAEEDSAAIGAGGVNGDAGATTGESDTDASRTSPPGAEDGWSDAAVADAGPPAPFTIVVVPDTQVTVYKWPDDYFSAMKWIVDTRTAKNTQYVLHVGDVQEWPKTISYYVNARKGMDMLAAANIPFSIAIGNHDFDKWSDGTHAAIAADRSTTIFNNYFPVSEAAKFPTFGGSYPTGSNDNNYHLFTAGGTDWMTLAINYQATDAEIAWANGVVAAHPKRRVIVFTHDYMNGGGNRDAFGNKLWTALVRKHANIEFVLCGHLSTAARRKDVGDNGNAVFQILSDYQNYDQREPNSYIRTMLFDPSAQTVSVKTYSPAFDKEMMGDAHDFVLTDVPFGPIP